MAGVTIERSPDGGARTPDGRLAGSTLMLDEAVRGWSGATEAPLVEAWLAASDRPAAAVAGLPTPLVPGSPASLVEMDDDGDVLRVMLAGRWIS